MNELVTLTAREAVHRLARREVSQYQNYDYAVVNDEIERCGGLLKSIVLAERARRQRMEPIVRSILDTFE